MIESTKRQLTIALALEVSVALRYALIQGVRDFSRNREDWHLARSHELSALSWKEAMASRPDGVIGIVRKADVPLVQAAQVPVVCVNSECELSGIVRVRCDSQATGVMAGEYLLGLGYDHFVYCTDVPTHHYSRLRWDGFRGAVEKSGKTPQYIEISRTNSRSRHYDYSGLAELEQRSAVYCVNDACARLVLTYCEEQNIAVPQHLAVLGTDNDSLLCEDGDILLSSIELNHRAVGFRAAQILDRVLSGIPAPVAPVLIPPRELVTRTSTEPIVAARHPLVIKALQTIEANCQRANFSTAALAEKCGVSTRTLGRTFASQGLPTPYHVLLEERIRRAKRLLVETDLTAEEIAYRSGFAEYSSFFRIFKRSVGCTPSEFR